MELSSGGQAPCRTGLPIGEHSRNPSVTVHQLGLLWEAAFSFSEFLWWLSTLLSISQWMIYERTCPHCAECSAVFDQKLHDPHAPLFLFALSHPEQLFFVSPQWKKVLKGKHSADVEEVKQKTVEALGIKIKEFKNCFEQWEKILIGVLHQMESTWKVTEVKHVRINTCFLINSGGVSGSPSFSWSKTSLA